MGSSSVATFKRVNPISMVYPEKCRRKQGLVLSHVPNWFALSGYTRFYMVYDWAGELKLSHEHDDYEWIYPEEATNYNLGKMYTQAIQDAFRKE